MKFALLMPALCLLASCGNHAAPEAKQPLQPESVKILQFYAGSGTVARGEQVLICYGVENAKAVRLEPHIETIAPSFNRCFQYSPAATSEIKLIATGADGSESSKTLEITVAGVAPPPKGQLILFFVSSGKSVARGQQVTLCYDTRNTSSVKIEPSPVDRKLAAKDCVAEQVTRKTKFTLIARGANGEEDRESLQVDVR